MLVRGDKSRSAVVEGDRDSAAAQGYIEGGSAAEPEQTPRNDQDDSLITLSREAYESSKNWFDSSIRAQQEKNLRAFNSQHPPGSKYHTEHYRLKSKIYRPKTRSFIRKQQAAAAIAFFSTSDSIHASAVNESNPAHVAAAELHMHLLNTRLEQEEMYWFQTVIGAMTDTAVTGVVCSKQHWKFNTRRDLIEEIYEAGGQEYAQYVEEESILDDRPEVTLIPLENMRFSPACDWRDPIRSSPYLIEMDPMFIGEIQEMQQRINPTTGRPHYRLLQPGYLAAAIHQDWDSIRKAREGDGRIDKYDNDSMVRTHQSAWVHRMTMRIGGRDYCWDMLGTEMILSDIVPIEERYLTGKRPYVWGNCNTEPHKNYPAGSPELVEGLQEETNDVANLRLDNVKLALNKRYYAKRGAGIDIRSLVRNVSGSVTMMMNPTSDVKTVETRDVTSSSYQEQDRLNLDMDDVLGDFSSSSVASNRKLNETVGGMDRMAGENNQIKELSVRTFAETWYQPVVRQLVELEAAYETDEAILLVGAETAGLQTVEQALQVITSPVRVKVNVGFDATDPGKRIDKLATGLAVIGKFAPQLMEKMDAGEFVKEIMGGLGYRDGTRFFPTLGRDEEDPRIAQYMETIEQMKAFIESKQAEQQGKIEVATITQEGAKARELIKAEVALILAQNKGNLEAQIVMMRNRLDEIDSMIAIETVDIKRRALFLQREALSHEIQEANRDYQLRLRGETMPEGGAMDLPGDDRAGIITRGNYGMIPGAAG